MGEIPNLIAARHIMLNSPMLKAPARSRGWVTAAGDVDWSRVEAGLPDFTLSGGELRLASFALALARAEVWGLNDQDYEVVRDALVLAADECSRIALDIRNTMERLGLA